MGFLPLRPGLNRASIGRDAATLTFQWWATNCSLSSMGSSTLSAAPRPRHRLSL